MLSSTFLFALACGGSATAPQPVEASEAAPAPSPSSSREQGSAPSAVPPSDFEPVVGPGKAPAGTSGWEADVTGPWAQGLRLATSDDGLEFRKTGEWVADQAGAPGAMVDDQGRLVVFYVAWQDGENFTAKAVRVGEGDWRYYRVDFQGEHARRPNLADPYVVALDDGRRRMYYTTSSDSLQKGFYSAVSSDGGTWVQEDGVRYTSSQPFHAAVVLEVEDGWWLFAGPQAGHSAFSRDGLAFDPRGPMQIAGASSFELHSAVAVDGGYRAYGATGPGRLASAFSTDGSSWTLESGSRWPDQSSFEGIGEHALVSSDDGWWMVYSDAVGGTSSSSSSSSPVRHEGQGRGARGGQKAKGRPR